MKLQQPLDQILKYTNIHPDRGKVRRYYDEWRLQNKRPEKCDNPACYFHSAPLEWNGTPLTLILDHIDGNSHNNTPSNLRLLCPNCDSQLETKGGRNIGRIQNENDRGYEIQHRKGHRDAKVFAPTLIMQLSKNKGESSQDS